MNVPASCSACLLLPAQVKINGLVQHHVDPSFQCLYSENSDKVYDDYNMAVIVSLLNFVCTKLVCKPFMFCCDTHCIDCVACLCTLCKRRVLHEPSV